MFLVGTIIRRLDNSTVSVEIKKTIRHKIYGKSILKIRRVLAHDTLCNFLVGDTVVIYKIRPVSKFKSWIIIV